MSNYLIHYGVKGMKWHNHTYVSENEQREGFIREKFIPEKKYYEQTIPEQFIYEEKTDLRKDKANQTRQALERSRSIGDVIESYVKDITNSDWYKKGKNWLQSLFD